MEEGPQSLRERMAIRPQRDRRRFYAQGRHPLHGWIEQSIPGIRAFAEREARKLTRDGYLEVEIKQA